MEFMLKNLLLLLGACSVQSFSNTLFQEHPTAQQTFPSRTDGIEIELPDFDELFDRVKMVSPLARVALEGRNTCDERGGFDAIDDECKYSKKGLRHEMKKTKIVKSFFLSNTCTFASPIDCAGSKDMKWKVVESNKRRTVTSIEKIDNFQDLGAPILRFRSSFRGPCEGEPFANYIMELTQRKKWDIQIEDVYEAYPILDLESANMAMGLKYGDCSRLGVGYCRTKSNLGIDSREQLTMCGINDFSDGSCLIWGTEMEEWHDHLFPPGRERVTRAKSHIFSTTLVPTGPDSFDVEYVLQLDIGGRIPTWMTTPIVVESVKRLFGCAKQFYLNKDGELEEYLSSKVHRMPTTDGLSLLLTP